MLILYILWRFYNQLGSIKIIYTMRNIKSPLKQLEYASKLKLVDNHLSRRESNQHLVNMEY
jgi:hypothetical protein